MNRESAITSQTCENCAFCSVYTLSFRVVCDIDEHEIADEGKEGCDSFEMCE